MRINWDLWYIKKNGDEIAEIAVRFFEGDIVTEDVLFGTGDIRSVTRYKRLRRLDQTDINKFLKNRGTFITDGAGNTVLILRPSDYSLLFTEEQMNKYLNAIIALDQTRQPIDSQTQL